MLALLNNSLVGDEDSTVKLSGELTFELSASAVAVERKHTIKIFEEWLEEELLDKSST